MTTRKITAAAAIAALYCALTVALAPISYGPFQCRIAEVLTVLPFFIPEAIPGLFVGCILANAIGALMGATSVLDIVVGSGATLLAAYLTSKTRHIALAPLPPVICNAVIIGALLTYMYGAGNVAQFPVFALEVGVGELAVCFAGGIPLLVAMRAMKLDERLGNRHG